MIPVPVLRVRGRCQCKSGKMKSDPSATVVHILFKCFSLRLCFRSCIKKKNYLVTGKEFLIQVVPVVGGVVGEVVSGAHFIKPLVRFVHIADMSPVIFSGVKT